MTPAVFLDRDGTMIEDVDYLSRPGEVHWFPWTVDAIRLLNREGLLVIVATNQGGVGLGLYTEQDVADTHEAMSAYLRAGGARVDAWYYCPHHPQAAVDALRIECDCRKPGGGLVRRACGEFDIDLTRSFVVGDKRTDVGLAAGVGAHGVLVRTGRGERELRAAGGALPGAALVAANLMEATSWIIQASRGAAG